jgi:hypothetical protein
MRRNTLLLVALFAGVIAAAPQPTLKNRLGQMNAKNLAQVQGGSGGILEGGVDCGELPPLTVDLPDLNCPCEFTELPGLGAGLSQSFQQKAEATQVSQLAAVPDTQLNQICQTNCCECAEAAHAALAVQAKNRTFTIEGSISVLERVYFAERERAAENSISESQKDTVCVTTNENGGLGAPAKCITVEVCPPPLQ